MGNSPSPLPAVLRMISPKLSSDLGLLLHASLLLLVACGAVAAADASSREPFDQRVLPFLQRHCCRCHGETKQEGEFRLDTLSRDFNARADREAWSAAVERISSGEMPPEDEQNLPTAAEREAVVTWLAARLPKEQEDRQHWAFQPLVRPAGKGIDDFVERRLGDRGLELSPPAEPARLLRRVYLGLTGLPPSPAESRALATDPSEEHFASIVDRLLASPRYGERWGRHWLDLARYADSNGLHEDTDRPHAWRYRDYVIASFNADRPYGQFIREQLAGDEIDPESPQAWIATGFSRNGPSNEENVAQAELTSYRLDQLDDILATTWQVFLGQTIQCARCHNHKLEPLKLTDYYRQLAVFDPSVSAYVPWRDQKLGSPKRLPVRPRDNRKPPKEPHIRALTDLGPEPPTTFALLRGNPNTPGAAVEPAVPEVLRHFPPDFSIHPRQSTTGRRAALADWIASPENPLTWRVMANRLWQYHFGRGLSETPNNLGTSGARPTHPELLDWLACVLRDNGGRLKPVHKLIVQSRTYRQSSSHRPAAARSDPENRTWWRYQPHRLEAEVVRDSILLASGKLNLQMGGPGIQPRLPAELLRRSKRNSWARVKQESAEHWRRSVYIYIKRQLPMPMLDLLDAPDAAQSCAVRFTSTTPTQSLVLLNDQFVNQQARFLAERALAEDSSAAVQTMIQRVWALPVSAEKVAEGEAFVTQRTEKGRSTIAALTDLGVVLFNSSQFVYVD